MKGDVITDEARFEKAQVSATELQSAVEKNAPEVMADVAGKAESKTETKKYYEGFDASAVLGDISLEKRKSITLNNPVLDAVKCDGSAACAKIRTFLPNATKTKPDENLVTW